MGDAGEGLVDNDARIQERRGELERAKAERRAAETRDPKRDVEIESLRLARIELQRQLDATTHERRRAALTDALAELDRRITQTSPSS
jgi:hypothetical protein